MRAGRLQTRYVPVGPVIVPESVRPCGSGIVGQPLAGVISVLVGAGVGDGAGLLIMTFPPVPGDAMSLAPQPLRTATEAVANNMRRKFEFVMFPVSSVFDLDRMVVAPTMQTRVGSPPRTLIKGCCRNRM